MVAWLLHARVCVTGCVIAAQRSRRVLIRWALSNYTVERRIATRGFSDWSGEGVLCATRLSDCFRILPVAAGFFKAKLETACSGVMY